MMLIKYFGVYPRINPDFSLDEHIKINNAIYDWTKQTFGDPYMWPPITTRHWFGNNKFYWFSHQEDLSIFLLKWTA